MEIFSNFRDANTDPYMLYIKEKYDDKPFTFWYDKFPSSQEELIINPYNFLFLHEPDEFFGMHSHASKVSSLFTSILTWNDSLLSTHDNAFNFTYSGQTLDNSYINKLNPKKFNISFLCGTKSLVEGHKLRPELIGSEIKSHPFVPDEWIGQKWDNDKVSQYFEKSGMSPEVIDHFTGVKHPKQQWTPFKNMAERRH